MERNCIFISIHSVYRDVFYGVVLAAAVMHGAIFQEHNCFAVPVTYLISI